MNDPWIHSSPTSPPFMAAPFPLGAMPPAPAGVQGPQRAELRKAVLSGTTLLMAVGGALLAGYHGFKRNGDSPLWGLLWGGAGFWCPIVTVPMAFSQGFGKRED